MTTINFATELKKQLNFLKNSSELYDRGFQDEAVRIATSIRVLMHDTNNSTSLLTHLKSKPILLASSIEKRDNKQFVAYSGFLSHISAKFDNPLGGPPTIDAVSVPYGPDAFSHGCLLPVDEWWNQSIYLFPNQQSYSRRDIVLAAANKDGGAHVDKVLPVMYARLISGHASSKVVSTNDKAETIFQVQIAFGDSTDTGYPIKNFQYADLRQMATELLHSPELLRCCE